MAGVIGACGRQNTFVGWISVIAFIYACKHMCHYALKVCAALCHVRWHLHVFFLLLYGKLYSLNLHRLAHIFAARNSHLSYVLLWARVDLPLNTSETLRRFPEIGVPPVIIHF